MGSPREASLLPPLWLHQGQRRRGWGQSVPSLLHPGSPVICSLCWVAPPSASPARPQGHLSSTWALETECAKDSHCDKPLVSLTSFLIPVTLALSSPPSFKFVHFPQKELGFLLQPDWLDPLE